MPQPFGRSTRALARPALAALAAALLILIAPALPGLPPMAARPALAAEPVVPAPQPPPKKRYLPAMPTDLTLCGEKVPMKLPFVAEQMDREFNVAVHDQAQVVMWLKRAGRYFPYFSRELKKAGMPDDLKYLAVAESALRMRARSMAGAVGMWQFIPGTAKRYGLKVNRWVDQRRNVAMATGAALRYLRDLYDQFGTWTLAMAAYNCGERRVEREVSEQGVKDYYNLYLPGETMRYVFRILAAKIIIQDPEAYGYVLPDEQLYDPQDTDSVNLKLAKPLHLRMVAMATGTTVRRLRELNPELRTHWLPSGRITIQVPSGKGPNLEKRIAKLKSGRPTGVSSRPPASGGSVVVKSGDTLSSIARRHGVKVHDLRRANRIKGSVIRPGQTLIIP